MDHRGKKEICAKSSWRNKNKCPHKNEKGQSFGQNLRKSSTASGLSRERKRSSSSKAQRVQNEPEEEEEEAPTSGDENLESEDYCEEQIRRVLSSLAIDGKKIANSVKLTLNNSQTKNVVMNLTSIWKKKKSITDPPPPCFLGSVESPHTNVLATSGRSVQTLAVQYV